MAVSGVRLVLLGKPGAGKGTQAALLSAHYGVEHLSTGDVFRSAVAQGTPTGLEVKHFMDTGELVPDEIVIRVVDEHFAAGGPLEDGFILDGFPRTLVQAEELERVLHGPPPRPRARHRGAHRDRSSTASPAGGSASAAVPPTT